MKTRNPFRHQVTKYKDMSKEVPLEEDEGMSLSQWLSLKKIPHFHVTNENVFSITSRKKLKRQGLFSGVPDYVVFTPSKILFIELKRRAKTLKNGKLSTSHTKLSDNQKEWLETINLYDYAVAKCCYGWNEAQEFIEEYL